jgi:hypothetical protein
MTSPANGEIVTLGLLRPPAFRECGHRGLARRRVAVRRRVTHPLCTRPEKFGAAGRRRVRSGLSTILAALVITQRVSNRSVCPSMAGQRQYTERLWVLNFSPLVNLQSSE